MNSLLQIWIYVNNSTYNVTNKIAQQTFWPPEGLQSAFVGFQPSIMWNKNNWIYYDNEDFSQLTCEPVFKSPGALVLKLQEMMAYEAKTASKSEC